MTTKQDREFLDKVASLGCLICRRPAELHHPKGSKWSSMGKKAAHKYVLPICSWHHRTGGYGMAYHAGAKRWEDNFGTQEELLIKRDKLLERIYGNS